MLAGDVVDQLLDQHRLAGAGAAEEADLAALHVRCDQVDDLDAGLEDLDRRGEVAERGWIAVDRPALDVLARGLLVVDRLADHVPDPAERGVPDGNRDRRARVDDVDPTREPIGRVHGHRADAVVAEVLLHLRNQRPAAVSARDLDRERVVDRRQLVREDCVDDDALDLDHLAGSRSLRLLRHISPCLGLEKSGRKRDARRRKRVRSLPKRPLRPVGCRRCARVDRDRPSCSGTPAAGAAATSAARPRRPRRARNGAVQTAARPRSRPGPAWRSRRPSPRRAATAPTPRTRAYAARRTGAAGKAKRRAEPSSAAERSCSAIVSTWSAKTRQQAQSARCASSSRRSSCESSPSGASAAQARVRSQRLDRVGWLTPLGRSSRPLHRAPGARSRQSRAALSC